MASFVSRLRVSTSDTASHKAGMRAYLSAVVSAYLDEDAEGMKRLEAFIEENKDDNDSLYAAACAYSTARSSVTFA